MLKHHSLAFSIATAECVSSGASLGAVWLLGKNEHLIAPARDYIARHIVYPCESCLGEDSSKSPPHEGKYDPRLMEKAQTRASLLLKGAIMMTAGFATHVPTQMLMEGRSDISEVKKVIKGKSLGIAATAASLWVIEKAKPGALEAAEEKIKKAMGKPDCPPGEGHDACHRQDDLCKLLVLEIPSSILTGLVNYGITHGRMR